MRILSTADLQSPTLPEIEAALARHAPEAFSSEPPARRAAVAIILRENPAAGVETLFIQRALHPMDPWSGHMAFPGGHQDPTDDSLEAAARRETLEEVGLNLSGGRLLGRLDEIIGGRLRPMNLGVTPFVFRHEGKQQLQLNSEIADAIWVPLPYLGNAANVRPYAYPPDPLKRTYPSFQYRPRDSESSYTIWGMTYRMIADFWKVLGHEIPGDGSLTDAE